jgi:hypothetical protein
MSSGRDGTRLTRWETVGAWTHLWTPPKGLQVPPIPWRKLALGTLLGLVFVGIGLALLVPPLDQGKREGAAREARKQAALVAAEAARLRVDQRLHRAAPPGATGTALVSALEGAITADANERVRTHAIQGPILRTVCERAGKSVVIRPGTWVYKCTAMTTDFRPGQAGVSFATGYPFVATIDFRRHTLAWCKTNPQPGEKTRGYGLARVELSPECAGGLAKLL